MTTISTRPLSAARPNDHLSITFDPAYSNVGGQSGYIKVVVSSIIWTGTGLSTTEQVLVDARSGLFDGASDVPLVKNVSIPTNTQVVTTTQNTLIVAVNRGVPGPNVSINGDGTWDVLNVITQLPGGTAATNFVLTVTYTMTWVPLFNFTGCCGSSSSTGSVVGSTNYNGSLALSVSDDKMNASSSVLITPVSGSSNGVYYVLPKELDTLFDENVVGVPPTTPTFSVVNIPTPNGNGSQDTILSHSVAQASSHAKLYLSDTVFLYAVNAGVIDGNGSLLTYSDNGSSVSKHILGSAYLFRAEEDLDGTKTDATFTFGYGYIPG